MAYSKLKNEYPHLDIQFVFVKTNSNAIKAVHLNAADAAITSAPVGGYLIAENGWNNLKIAANTGWPELRLKMGVKKEWPLFVSILEKTLAEIPKSTRMEINKKWVPIHIEQEVNYVYLLKRFLPVIGGLGILLMGVTFFLILMVRKNRQLTEAEQEIHKAYLEVETAVKVAETYSENLETMVSERTAELQQTVDNLHETQFELIQSEKLASIGQLSAGIAHEINTPIQYVGDNIRFLMDAFNDILTYIDECEELYQDSVKMEQRDLFIKALAQCKDNADLEFLKDEIPTAITQTLEGVAHVSKIVQSMKEFSHPAKKEKAVTDLNKALENTVVVSRNEWKYVAEVEMNLAPDLPSVPCFPGN